MVAAPLAAPLVLTSKVPGQVLAAVVVNCACAYALLNPTAVQFARTRQLYNEDAAKPVMLLDVVVVAVTAFVHVVAAANL